jgi:hypothetical protein
VRIGQPILPINVSNEFDRRLINALTDYLRPLANKVNGLASGVFSDSADNASAALPTIGSYAAGDYVRKAVPAIAGGAGSRYVVYGWLRITNGEAHVLNTDWVEDRRSTGA